MFSKLLLACWPWPMADRRTLRWKVPICNVRAPAHIARRPKFKAAKCCVAVWAGGSAILTCRSISAMSVSVHSTDSTELTCSARHSRGQSQRLNEGQVQDR